MEIKVPTKFKRIDSSQLTEADVDTLLIFYQEVGKIAKNSIIPSPPPKQEILEILGIKVECK